ncbi:MAG: hypothetical protein PGN09_08555 [Sphingomonas fennica]
MRMTAIGPGDGLPPVEQAAYMRVAMGPAAGGEAMRRFNEACLGNDIALTSYWMEVVSELAAIG